MRRPNSIVMAMLIVAAGTTAHAASAPAARDSSGMALRGGQDGTAFRSLTVEGEDRVHFQIERPSLELALDPATAPGLDWGSATDVLDRSAPDGVAPYLRGSASKLSPFLGRPWLHAFASGAIARFALNVEGVEKWKLLVADSRGQVVATFQGDGKPPREITWDGRTSAGESAPPGRTFSYVLEARDKAGNKRNFVGQGFELPPYFLRSATGPALAFVGGQNAATTSSPHVLEAASWLNQSPPATSLRVTATARSFEQGNALAASIAKGLSAHLLGSTARVQTQVKVEADAHPAGTIHIATAP